MKKKLLEKIKKTENQLFTLVEGLKTTNPIDYISSLPRIMKCSKQLLALKNAMMNLEEGSSEDEVSEELLIIHHINL